MPTRTRTPKAQHTKNKLRDIHTRRFYTHTSAQSRGLPRSAAQSPRRSRRGRCAHGRIYGGRNVARPTPTPRHAPPLSATLRTDAPVSGGKREAEKARALAPVVRLAGP